jgi:hypothetical protein
VKPNKKEDQLMPFTNGSDPEILSKSAAIAEALTPEKLAYLFSLFPTSESFSALTNRMGENYPAFLKGDPEKVKEFELDRITLNSNLSLIVGLAKLAAVVDPTVPESLALGRPAEKVAPASVHLSIPQDLKITFDRQGVPLVSVSKVPGAKGYQVWACDSDPSLEANWKLVAASPSCRSIQISGLNRGKFNVLKIRAMRANGAGPWSNWVSLDPNL